MSPRSRSRASGGPGTAAIRFLLLPVLTSIAIASAARAEGVITLAIQPFGSIKKNIISRVSDGITGVYRVAVIILPAVDLPGAAYYRPRGRYRADTLLDFLNTGKYRKYDRVLGLTDRDISSTKGAIYDWGIFGLGTIDGRPCVVSTFRLRRGADEELFSRRLIKVVNHELGHTFGLPHCPVQRCLMEDAKGTIVTVDRESGEFCGSCKKRLRALNICRQCEK